VNTKLLSDTTLFRNLFWMTSREYFKHATSVTFKQGGTMHDGIVNTPVIKSVKISQEPEGE
jgi:hypothetical protein